MATLSTQPNPLRWTGGYHNQKALWSREPDIAKIKTLASKHLASELPNTLDLDQIEVAFFAQGGFNKLYAVSCSPHTKKYLFRVALPLVPYYRIESEAAVLSWIRSYTTIPVARVVAWDSSAENELGFEWILLEHIDGIPLYDVWRKITWESKLKIVAALAPLLGQLRDHNFDRIGSLYFRERQPEHGRESKHAIPASTLSVDSPSFASRSDYDKDGYQYERQASELTVAQTAEQASEHERPPETVTGTLSISAVNNDYDAQTGSFFRDFEDTTRQQASKANQYVVGPLLDPLFYLNRRLYLPGNRGPYGTSREWMAAEIEFQMSWAKTGPLIKTLANRGDFNEYDWDSDCDEEAPEMERLSNDYQDVLPKIFPADEGSSPYAIYHHDLSLANILMNPDTCEITGIIDWETIRLVAEWKRSRFPKFLTDQMDLEEIDDTEPRIPTAAEYDEDGETYNAMAVERRDRWENRILRQHFDETLSRTRGEGPFSNHVSDSAKIKEEFEDCVMDITDNTPSARWWLNQYLESTMLPEGSK